MPLIVHHVMPKPPVGSSEVMSAPLFGSSDRSRCTAAARNGHAVKDRSSNSRTYAQLRFLLRLYKKFIIVALFFRYQTVLANGYREDMFKLTALAVLALLSGSRAAAGLPKVVPLHLDAVSLGTAARLLELY